jgi:hypothetical protein
MHHTLQVAGYGTHNTYLRSPERTVRVTPDQIVESVDASLKRLGTDYIDLLQVGLWWVCGSSRDRVCAGDMGCSNSRRQGMSHVQVCRCPSDLLPAMHLCVQTLA